MMNSLQSIESICIYDTMLMRGIISRSNINKIILPKIEITKVFKTIINVNSNVTGDTILNTKTALSIVFVVLLHHLIHNNHCYWMP